MSKTYDIVLLGATGFTGRQAAKRMATRMPRERRWAVAGRSLQRLEELNQEIHSGGSQADSIVVDALDERAMEKVAERARVVAATVGPFSLYGENLIAACARHGTDYVDITGETAFVGRMITKYQAAAQASGAKLIPCCGFDSVPSDLGVFTAVSHVRQVLGEGLKTVDAYFSIRGGLNGGTLATLTQMFESGDWDLMQHAGVMIPDCPEYVSPRGQATRVGFDRAGREWIAPFFMGVINTRVVTRSAALSAKWGTSYGDGFSYAEHQRLGAWWNPLPALAVSAGQGILSLMGRTHLSRKLLAAIGPEPGSGPTNEAMARGFYFMEIIGACEGGRRVGVRFAGKGDPGNRATTLFLCEAALCLANEREELPGGSDRCGFLTPATGLGTVLANRLTRSGVSIEVFLHDG